MDSKYLDYGWSDLKAYHLRNFTHEDIPNTLDVCGPLAVGSLGRVDLLIITGLQAGSPEQRASTNSTSLCPHSVLFCFSALIKAQERRPLFFFNV